MFIEVAPGKITATGTDITRDHTTAFGVSCAVGWVGVGHGWEPYLLDREQFTAPAL
jgi:hypothetical protein